MSIATIYTHYYTDVNGNQQDEKCSACNSIINQSYKFCPTCGAKLRRSIDNVVNDYDLLFGYTEPKKLFHTNTATNVEYTNLTRRPKSQYLKKILPK